MDVFETLMSMGRMATPLAFAALGGLLSEKAGIVNIVLEGKLLVAAFAAAVVAHYTGSAWWGLAAGSGSAMLLAWVFAFSVLVLRADQIVAGIALNMLAFGIPPFVSKILFDMTGNTPALGREARFGYEPLILVFLALLAVWTLLYRTRFGLWLRFAGECPEALAAQGLKPSSVRWTALTLSGFVTGIGGTALSLMLASGYSRNMTAGRGYMALAAVILGKWRPVPAVVACLLFGLAEAAQMQLQGGSIPLQWVQALPYLITLVVLAGVVGYSAAPRALGRS